ncbi:hypothetical protein [Methylocystis sp.]|uniref:hypothetical protein n=1 Tax=Methylocystis sp. TaxID=1911079 RepID=UPI003D13BB43
MRTPQWIKKLGGHAGELFVCAELSKRGIPNALLPENFSDDDILVGSKDGSQICYVQVKSCHPDRSASFILRETDEKWQTRPIGELCVFVWLGSTKSNDPPQYWIAEKQEVGRLCAAHSAHGTSNWERRFYPNELPADWKDRWSLFDRFRPTLT